MVMRGLSRTVMNDEYFEGLLLLIIRQCLTRCSSVLRDNRIPSKAEQENAWKNSACALI
jgi:hypothetical protein